jgi:glycosyltransferase involved in cell wall biosynthesis
MRKKRVLFHSDFSLAKTGFGRVMKTLLSYLYKTGKYEVHHVCCGMSQNSPELHQTPWKSYGAITADQRKLNEASRDPSIARSIGYGAQTIDDYIKEIKPDIYIGTQDFWGVDFSIDKNWFNKITSCIWTTLDSLPLLPSAVKKAKDIKNYWVWSNFAEKEFKRLGFDHVKTVHGAIESKFFYKLPDEERKKLRLKNNIPEDATIIGFVFRNQLRKLVPNLMEGYKIWKNNNPDIKNTYLLLHTSLSEGWNIKSQAIQHGIDTKEILVTYICSKCGDYEVKSFDKKEEPLSDSPTSLEGKNCPFCNTKGTQNTTSVSLGVTEQQLNEVYNLMDVYVHAFTSGGQEIPIQEAKLTELITLVTNYSCGEECCEKDAHSLPLKWNKYIEHGTEFIKASTCPNSIAEQLDIFFKMPKKEKEKWGKAARKWVLQNFSTESVGEKIENFFDSSPYVDEEDEAIFIQSSVLNPNPNGAIIPGLQDKEWVKSLYRIILDRTVEDDDEGLLYWMQELSKNTPREQIENYFRHVALKDLQDKKNEIAPSTLFPEIDQNGNKKILFVMPESAGDIFMATALLESINDRYPNYDLYFSTKRQFKDILNGNKYIYKWIEYTPEMDNLLLLEGHSKSDGYFDIAYLPHLQTQRMLSYLHNGEDKIDFEIYKK